MASRYADMFMQTFTVRPHVSSDLRGVDSFGSAVTYACRFQPSDRLARSADGSERVASGIIYTEAAVTVLDTIWPPGADSSDINEGRKPISVHPRYDLETGLLDHFQIVY